MPFGLVFHCGTRTGVADNLQSQHDDQKVKDFGVTLAAKMISRLTTEADIKGVHFCTLNLERSVPKNPRGATLERRISTFKQQTYCGMLIYF